MPSSPDPSRRQVLSILGGLGGLGLLTLAGCGDGDPRASRTKSSTPSLAGSTSPTTDGSTTSATAASSCAPVPQETAGPYPGDGSNGPDVLAQNGVVRSDLRSSFASGTGSVGGVPLTVKVTVLDLKNGCRALAGAALYAWHCDADGRYSMYSQGVTGENWLRGVQATDASGTATFTTVFPGAYAGRWPHIHFEVYPSIGAATGGGTKLTTSQIALPDDACKLVYATSGYATSARNIPQTPLASDNVFRDGVSQQLSTVTGTPAGTMVSSLTIAV
jgi:protocatechuate 3,4-dioxygenase beta subunit